MRRIPGGSPKKSIQKTKESMLKELCEKLKKKRGEKAKHKNNII